MNSASLLSKGTSNMSWSPPETLQEKLKRWLVPPSLYIKYLYKKNTLKDEKELLLIPYLARKTKASIDVGANKGIYSYIMQKHSGSVFAFEPNPKMFRILATWAKGNIKIFQEALGSEAGNAVLRLPKSSHGYSNQAGSLNPFATKGKEVGEVPVKVSALDDLDLPEIGFIKIDVEGFEFDALKGARKIIAKDKPNLLIEIEERHTGRSLKEMIQEVCDYGYIALNFSNNGELKFIEFDSFTVTNSSNNFIFLPK